MRLGIGQRLLLLTLGIAIPLVLIGVLDLRRVWNIGRTQLNRSVEQQAELAAIAFERWVDAQREPLVTIAAIAADGKTESLETSEYVVKTRRYWIDLRIVDTSGKAMFTYPPNREQPPPALVDHLLRQTRERRSWVLVTDRTRDESRPIFAIAAPIETGGAVIARIDGTAINELFRDIELPGDAVIVIFDAQGQILYRKHSANLPITTDVSSSPLFSVLGNQRLAVAELESPYDEIRRVYGLCRAGPTNFVIVVGVPSATLYEPMRRQFVRYLLISLLALFFAVLAAILMQRHIVRPIHRLRAAAQTFGSGDFSVRAPADTRSELGDLGEAFNRMAAQLKEREERLSELDRLKSDFVSSVSHELRTPLTTIKTLTHVLLGKSTDAERREYLGTIDVECNRQIDLVTNLLDLSRIESGACQLDLRPVDAAEVVATCLKMEKHIAEIREQKLYAELPPGLPLVQADKTVLRRILCSLIENAIKYTAKGGEITLGAQVDHQELRLYVKDNGSGIAKTDLPHIFEKFYRGRAQSEQAGESAAQESVDQPGVGLGLYLVRALVEQIGARITVESELGKGSKFTVHLPIWQDRQNLTNVRNEDVETVARSR